LPFSVSEGTSSGLKENMRWQQQHGPSANM